MAAGDPRRSRVALLLISLGLVCLSVVLLSAIGYATDHRYDQGFDWVSSAVIQPIACGTFSILGLGLILAVAAVVRGQK